MKPVGAIEDFFGGLKLITVSAIVVSIIGFILVWTYAMIKTAMMFDAPLIIVTGTLVWLLPLLLIIGVGKYGQRFLK